MRWRTRAIGAGLAGIPERASGRGTPVRCAGGSRTRRHRGRVPRVRVGDRPRRHPGRWRGRARRDLRPRPRPSRSTPSATSLGSDGSVAYVPYTGNRSPEGVVLVKRPDEAGFRPLSRVRSARRTRTSRRMPTDSSSAGATACSSSIPMGGASRYDLPDAPFVQGMVWWESPTPILAVQSELGAGGDEAATVLVLIDPQRATLRGPLRRRRCRSGVYPAPRTSPAFGNATSTEGFGRVDLRTGRVETLLPGLAYGEEIAPGVLLYSFRPPPEGVPLGRVGGRARGRRSSGHGPDRSVRCRARGRSPPGSASRVRGPRAGFRSCGWGRTVASSGFRFRSCATRIPRCLPTGGAWRTCRRTGVRRVRHGSR